VILGETVTGKYRSDDSPPLEEKENGGPEGPPFT
jgi:hypothetical protein